MTPPFSKLTILQNGLLGKKEREEFHLTFYIVVEEQMLKCGYPAYTTSCAWLGYPDDQLKQLCSEALNNGWTRYRTFSFQFYKNMQQGSHEVSRNRETDITIQSVFEKAVFHWKYVCRFKVKVGADLQDDMRRCRLVREMIGPENMLMLDANQRWEVDEAIDWVTKLAAFKPLWIEEPTSPDDILGHAKIAKALSPLGIGVATGEQCHNRVIFKQLLQARALSYVQVDSCRLGSVNENLSVLLMAKKFQIPVCPHAGGVGLCELVQHLIIFDYISVSGTLENRMCEYVDHLHEHFKYPVVIMNASYMPPQAAGYSTEMKEDSARKYQFPEGEVWQKLLSDHSATKIS
ncbi:Mitochondrial enolase superfamily member 1 [Varanus komodoensis]|nr:Mitochondrial enolase superfamily member 1 [Varanus komodoensis]